MQQPQLPKILWSGKQIPCVQGGRILSLPLRADSPLPLAAVAERCALLLSWTGGECQKTCFHPFPRPDGCHPAPLRPPDAEPGTMCMASMCTDIAQARLS